MKTRVGLWIDHRKAFIVAVTDRGEEIGLVVSKLEKHLRRSGGNHADTTYESQQVPADDRQDRKFTGLLNIYYKAVISCIADAESILIFGPGEAKGELQKRLKKNHLGGRIVGVEAIDKMTDREIAAKVRQYYQATPGSPTQARRRAREETRDEGPREPTVANSTKPRASRPRGSK
jgi:hypothetical protein